jgi:hypothetical protein
MIIAIKQLLKINNIMIDVYESDNFIQNYHRRHHHLYLDMRCFNEWLALEETQRILKRVERKAFEHFPALVNILDFAEKGCAYLDASIQSIEVDTIILLIDDEECKLVGYKKFTTTYSFCV